MAWVRGIAGTRVAWVRGIAGARVAWVRGIAGVGARVAYIPDEDLDTVMHFVRLHHVPDGTQLHQLRRLHVSSTSPRERHGTRQQETAGTPRELHLHPMNRTSGMTAHRSLHYILTLYHGQSLAVALLDTHVDDNLSSLSLENVSSDT